MKLKTVMSQLLAVLIATSLVAPAWSGDNTKPLEGQLTQQSIQQYYDELDHQRAVQSYLWSIPAMYTYSLRESLKETFGASPTDVPVWKDLMDAKTVMLTPNSQVVYAFNFIRLTKEYIG